MLVLFPHREETAHVLYELKAWIENNRFPAHFPIEVRFLKGDNLLLSPSHGRDSCYINIIMYRFVCSICKKRWVHWANKPTLRECAFISLSNEVLRCKIVNSRWNIIIVLPKLFSSGWSKHLKACHYLKCFNILIFDFWWYLILLLMFLALFTNLWHFQRY